MCSKLSEILMSIHKLLEERMLLNIQTVAQQLQISQSTLWRWIREGRLPIVRLGRRVLIKEEALQEFINQAEHLTDDGNT